MARAHHPRRFLAPAERERIAQEIKWVAEKSSGEVRVHFDRHCPSDPEEVATRIFRRHGMHGAPLRHGVLIYLAVRDHKFAVVGDEGIHRKVGSGFWQEVRDRMARAFAQDRFGEGIAQAVHDIGGKMAEAFPTEGR